MEVSNNELARILGRMEEKMDAHGKSMDRQEAQLAAVDKKLTNRLDQHDERLRMLENMNPEQQALLLQEHEIRIRKLETDGARAGAISGAASGIGIAVIIEMIRQKMGL